MPTPVDTASQLAAIIQAQLSSRTRTKSTNSRTTQSKTPTASASNAMSSLDSQISRRVKTIDLDDPERKRKTFRVFLEALIMSNFGEAVINDPKFYQLVDHVQSSMEADPQIGLLIDEAMNHLLARLN